MPPTCDVLVSIRPPSGPYDLCSWRGHLVSDPPTYSSPHASPSALPSRTAAVLVAEYARLCPGVIGVAWLAEASGGLGEGRDLHLTFRRMPETLGGFAGALCMGLDGAEINGMSRKALLYQADEPTTDDGAVFPVVEENRRVVA